MNGAVLSCSSSTSNVAVTVVDVCELSNTIVSPPAVTSESGCDNDKLYAPRPPLIVIVASVAAPVATTERKPTSETLINGGSTNATVTNAVADCE